MLNKFIKPVFRINKFLFPATLITSTSICLTFFNRFLYRFFWHRSLKIQFVLLLVSSLLLWGMLLMIIPAIQRNFRNYQKTVKVSILVGTIISTAIWLFLPLFGTSIHTWLTTPVPDKPQEHIIEVSTNSNVNTSAADSEVSVIDIKVFSQSNTYIPLQIDAISGDWQQIDGIWTIKSVQPSRLRVHFEALPGDEINLVFSSNPSSGIVNVILDDVLVETRDLYSPTGTQAAVYSIIRYTNSEDLQWLIILRLLESLAVGFFLLILAVFAKSAWFQSRKTIIAANRFIRDMETNIRFPFEHGSILIEIIIVLVMPVVIWAVYDLCLFNGSPYGDWDAHTTLIHNFKFYVQHIGLERRGIRYGILFPQIFFNQFFPPLTAYIIVRYLLAIISTLPWYLVFRQYAGRLVGLVTVVFILSHPIFLNSVLGDRYDGFVIAYVLAASGIVLLNPRNRIVWGLAGIIMTLAMNSYPLALFGLLMLPFVYILLNWENLQSRFFRDAPMVFLGITLCHGLAHLYYWLNFGTLDIYTPMLSAVSGTLGMTELTEAWIEPHFYMVTPILLTFSLFVLLIHNPDKHRTIWSIGIYCLLSLIPIYAFQVMKNDWLQRDFVGSQMLFPIIVPAFGVIAANIYRNKNLSSILTVVMSLVILISTPLLARHDTIDFSQLSFFGYIVVSAVLFILLVIIISTINNYQFKHILMLAMGLCITLYSTMAGTDYDKVFLEPFLNDPKIKTNSYQLMMQYLDTVEDISIGEDAGLPVVWFSTDRWRCGFNSIPCIFKHAFNFGLTKVGDGRQGIPYLDQEQITLLSEFNFLVVIGENQTELDEARQALGEHNIDEFISEDIYRLEADDMDMWLETYIRNGEKQPDISE